MWYFDRDFDFDTSRRLPPITRYIEVGKGEHRHNATNQHALRHLSKFHVIHATFCPIVSVSFVFYIDYSDSDQPTAGKFYSLSGLETCCGQVSLKKIQK